MGHRWVFALADAGVLLDLHSSPTFLMLPGKDASMVLCSRGKGQERTTSSTALEGLR